MITPVVENYPGFMRIGGKSLVDLLAQQAAQYSEIHVGEFVTEVEKDRSDNRIRIKTITLSTSPRVWSSPQALATGCWKQQGLRNSTVGE